MTRGTYCDTRAVAYLFVFCVGVDQRHEVEAKHE